MKTPVRIPTLLAAALLASLTGTPMAHAADDDAAKLKELERALASTPEGAQVGSPPQAKRRTRAIVFDNEPQQAPAAQVNAVAAEAAQTPAAGIAECAALPADVKAIAVDFAIQFNVGSATISSTSEHTLAQIAKILALSPERCVLVEGHTDSTGNADKNLALSRDRAGSVVNFISERNGVDRNRLVPIGKGSGDPLKNLDSRDPKNRRVVFKVVAG